MKTAASFQTSRDRRVAPVNTTTGAGDGADRLLLNGKRQKLYRRGAGRVRVGLVKPALNVGMDLHVTLVTEGQHVIEGVVPLSLRVAHAPVVDVVNMGSVGNAANPASEVVALQGLKVVPVSVLGDELGIPRASFGTVEFSGSGALGHRPANSAGKLYAASVAGFVRVIARVKLSSAAVASYLVELGLRVLMPKLASFASSLEFMVSTKLRLAGNAVSVSKRSFGHAEIYLIGEA